MNRAENISLQLQRVVANPVWRFAIGLRIRFNHPTLLYQTYPQDWVAAYAAEGLLLVDPAVRWGMTHLGLCNWADLAAEDEAGLFARAADHGLRHGIAVSVGDEGSRSIGFFARPDRAPDAAERALACDVMARLHDLTPDVATLPEADRIALQRMDEGLVPR
ncbi:MAG: autoinducer binding domain-containing protein [Rhodobacterales bacterium]|nr:autoinducer binding domain-containing protein [Rhodobacterales bacterium]